MTDRLVEIKGRYRDIAREVDNVYVDLRYRAPMAEMEQMVIWLIDEVERLRERREPGDIDDRLAKIREVVRDNLEDVYDYGYRMGLTRHGFSDQQADSTVDDDEQEI